VVNAGQFKTSVPEPAEPLAKYTVPETVVVLGDCGRAEAQSAIHARHTPRGAFNCSLRVIDLPAANQSRIVSFIRISFLPGNAVAQAATIALEFHRIPRPFNHQP
jgi:hypothetical protein